MGRNRVQTTVEYPNHREGAALLAGKQGLTCAGCGATIQPGNLYTKHYDFRIGKTNQPFCRACYPFWLLGTSEQEKREGVVEEWPSLVSIVSEDE